MDKSTQNLLIFGGIGAAILWYLYSQSQTQANLQAAALQAPGNEASAIAQGVSSVAQSLSPLWS